ncbi:MAG: hypothetical protein RL657_2176, partial [Pseudomonadota bacterium]
MKPTAPAPRRSTKIVVTLGPAS